MTDPERFDPFSDRLCRNVRNALCESLPEVLEQKDVSPARRIAALFLDDSPPTAVVRYIRHRLEAYQAILDALTSSPTADPLGIAMTLWNQGLFFETHEHLEPYWFRSEGDEKALLQALIRAAGTSFVGQRGACSQTVTRTIFRWS